MHQFIIVIAIWSGVASAAVAAQRSQRVEFVQEFRPAAKELVELWIPAPLREVEYQRLLSREVLGNATLVRIVEDDDGPVPLIYARWEKIATPHLKVINVLGVIDRQGGMAGHPEGDRFLKATRHVQTDGIVKQRADQITAGLTDPDAKARAIYDWIIDNSERDPQIRGCGLGDVKSLLTSGNLKGKCADLNSLFVGLSRAAGVPAREVFGQRIAPSSMAPSLGKEGDNSKAQHCRAEYYSKTRKAWIPVDPADVRKLVLEEKLALDHPRVKTARDELFGNWEGTWVAYNYARDFPLEGYDQSEINYFMYPLLAAAKFRPDGVEPQETGYAYKTTVLKP